MAWVNFFVWYIFCRKIIQWSSYWFPIGSIYHLYTTSMLPIGWLYGTYHLLREPETAIELSRFLLVERYTSLPGMFFFSSSVGFIAWRLMALHVAPPWGCWSIRSKEMVLNITKLSKFMHLSKLGWIFFKRKMVPSKTRVKETPHKN